MEFKNFAKALGSDLFAEILCLFLAVTLSAVGGGLFRLISCICTIAVLVCVCVNYALSRSREDQHKSGKIRLPSSCFTAARCCCRFAAGYLSAAGESRCAAGYVVSVVQAVECSVFAAVQSVQCRRDSFVPVVGKDSISGSVEPAAAGSGLGDLCIGEKWFPAGRTAISAEKIVPFMIGTDSFAEADALRAGRFPLPVPAERSATAPVIPEAAASGCGAAA